MKPFGWQLIKKREGKGKVWLWLCWFAYAAQITYLPAGSVLTAALLPSVAARSKVAEKSIVAVLTCEQMAPVNRRNKF